VSAICPHFSKSAKMASKQTQSKTIVYGCVSNNYQLFTILFILLILDLSKPALGTSKV
jgi:hypothetical protein